MSQVDDVQSRREVLFVTAGAAAVVTTGTMVAWPLVDQMNARADVKALSKIQVDVSGIAEGAQLVVEWQLQPVFIRHRTAEEIQSARETAIDDLKDENGRIEIDPALDAADNNRALDEEGKWLVAVGLCTHLGCVPTVNAGDFDGWFCPCHGSHYDTSGRIRSGPAPENLRIPPVRFISDTVIEIGV